MMLRSKAAICWISLHRGTGNPVLVDIENIPPTSEDTGMQASLMGGLSGLSSASHRVQHTDGSLHS